MKKLALITLLACCASFELSSVLKPEQEGWLAVANANANKKNAEKEQKRIESKSAEKNLQQIEKMVKKHKAALEETLHNKKMKISFLIN